LDRRWVVLLAGMGLLALLGLWSWRSEPPPSVAPERVVAPDPAEAPRTRALPAAAAQPQSPEAEAVEPQEAENKLVEQLLTEGDGAFERGDLQGATAVFQDIVERYPSSTYAPYAAYKLAWCKFNEGDRVEAIRSMELLQHWLETTEVPQAEALAKAARKDLELFRNTDD
jgi:TolA-binding protein